MKRIEYIDAMRGFNMILIVMTHLVGFYHGHHLDFSWSFFFTLFRLPLFFFISGFVMYKKERVWSVETTLKYLKNKAKIQLIPFFVFFSLSIYINKADFWTELCTDLKYGYWFTFTLFEYYVAYVLIMFISARLRPRGGKIILLILAILLIWSNRPEVYDVVNPNIVGVSRLRYFIFFFAGTLAKEYFSKFQMLLDNQYFMGTIIVVLLFIELFGLGAISESARFVVSGFMGLTIMFSFFRKYEHLFFHDTTVGRSLQYIGTHTLDIYLLHYFFLPHNLQLFGRFFSDFKNPTVELFVSLFLTLIIVAMCLITSNIIRLSPLLAHWVLGVKYTK